MTISFFVPFEFDFKPRLRHGFTLKVQIIDMGLHLEVSTSVNRLSLSRLDYSPHLSLINWLLIRQAAFDQASGF